MHNRPITSPSAPQTTVGNPQASPLPSGGLGGASGLAPELQRALEQGVVERSDHQAFRCRVCDKNVTGAAPCLEHLRSDKHKKKEQTQTQQPIPGFGQMTVRRFSEFFFLVTRQR